MDLDHLLICPYAQGSEQEGEGVDSIGGVGRCLFPQKPRQLKM